MTSRNQGLSPNDKGRQWRRMLIYSIRGGAINQPRPLNTKQSDAVTVSLYFPPAVSSTTPTHGYFLLSEVSLADGDPTIDSYHLTEIQGNVGEWEQPSKQPNSSRDPIGNQQSADRRLTGFLGSCFKPLPGCQQTAFDILKFSLAARLKGHKQKK